MASPTLLGLNKVNSTKLAGENQHNKAHFTLIDADKNKQWQISQSEFIDNGQAHQLLVFTNIESALRASQLNAWQQIIRVMGHEIRNSLTPVATIAESLSVRIDNERDQNALALISERCHHLQDFVSRYSSLNQTLNLSVNKFEITPLIERLKGLFVDENVKITASSKFLLADQAFIEQVLINLIKNASEADAKHIKVSFYQQDNKSCIDIVDDGHGFANVENLFVPLYSTKPEGQGIGLSFCRNIIEQHHGSIRLVNNSVEYDKAGVSVHLSLPFYH
jgi:nitrogen fixation/metabolism regulation signal transduction histidine kinase